MPVAIQRPGECSLRRYFLERACQAQVTMLAAGLDRLLAPPDGVADKVRQQTPPAGVAKAEALAWPALLRRLDRLDPGFRT
ncbi:hypothetical protein [Sphingomonas sp. ERG5]|uniref:hypothetical protein n=1 Tax=Sphingomonas sp. ERG5 TaxID=1381597 RepID=UPI00054B62F4|nr:hypothetical protein [Sphingomonas sp. ERG5]